MKCPKCGYLGFEAVDRCRNCGYEFSLARPVPDTPELPMRRDSADRSPLGDVALIDAAAPPLPAPAARSESVAAAGARPAAPRRETVDDLPLFDSAFAADDVPLITKPSPPRPP